MMPFYYYYEWLKGLSMVRTHGLNEATLEAIGCHNKLIGLTPASFP